jgi:DNA invertase Pin-like site-specific DNA recombinase
MPTLLGGLAEFERDPIRVRTGEGRERAKASGQSLGRKLKLTSCRQHEPIGRRDRASHWAISPAAATSARARFPASQPGFRVRAC